MGPNTGPIKNISKSLSILKSPKTNLKFPFLIAQSSPIFSILQSCRAIDGCYWTKIAKKNEKVYKEKEVKKPQKLELFQKKDLNFAISKFSKFFTKYLFYNIEALLEVSLGKKIQKKNKNGNKEIGEKNHVKCEFSRKDVG